MRNFSWLVPLAASGLLLTACGGASAPEPQPYTVSGTVEDENGHAIEGVTISFGGAADDTTTDSNGKWFSPELRGEVTVTPTHDDYAFDPQERAVSASSDSVDFTALELLSLSDTVADAADEPVGGVIITLSFSGQEFAITTDSAGFWEQDGLHGTVTVTPTRDGFAFDPEFEEHSDSAAAVDFTGELQPCTAGDVTDRDNPCIIYVRRAAAAAPGQPERPLRPWPRHRRQRNLRLEQR